MYTIYGKVSCGFCIKAKRLLDKQNLEYTYEDIGKNKDAHHFVKNVLEATTVPQVMLTEGGVVSHIGGYEQLKKHLEGNS